MITTYSEARAKATAILARDWPVHLNDLWVGEAGAEDEKSFWVPYGAKDQVIWDQPMIFVDKETEEVSSVDQFDGMDRVDGMTHVRAGR